MSTSAVPVPPSDLGIATPRSEKSNAWPWEERLDIYNRRLKGEGWDTICPQSPVKPNDSRRRKASIDAVLTPVNGVDAVNENSDHDSGSDPDDADSDNGGNRVPAGRSTRKTRLAHTDSDENAKPKERQSAPKPRLSKILKRTAKDQTPDEPERPDEAVSTRPKRSRVPRKNYSLLLPNSDLDLNGESNLAAATEGLKKSKIICFRTGPPTRLLNGVREPETKAVRSSASADSDVEVRKSPVSPDEHQAGVRKSMRGKKMAVDHLTTTRIESDVFRKKMRTPKGRKPRMLAHLDASEVDAPSVPATASVKKGKKRKRSEDRVGSTHPVERGTASPLPDPESEQPEKKKRRKQKPRHDLGFLPNGQPRKRRRRRTRQEILLDQQTPKTVTTRRRGKYQFPYLAGYTGPDPPDQETVIARQEEMERRDRAPVSSSEEEPESELDSADEGTSIHTPTKEPEQDPTDTDNSSSKAPNTDVPVSAICPPQTPCLTAAIPTEPHSTKTSFHIPDIVFFPEDLVKGRGNATLLRSAIEAEKVHERSRIADLTQQLSDVREGFIARLEAQKQEHERAIGALKASLQEERDAKTELAEKWDMRCLAADESSKKATDAMAKQLQEKDDIIKQLQTTVEENNRAAATAIAAAAAAEQKAA
ncbi:MAG: hypothetical protein LQ341_002576, partial [Variospora aurantia]